MILYYSRNGSTQQLADAIANGVRKAGAEPLLRTIASDDDAASARDLALSTAELQDCDALIMGSPTRFGHMHSGLQKFWEQTSREWLRGALVDKPAAVFTSSSSMHGGQESTLLSMLVPLLHHGMMVLGIPYTEPGLQQTTSGGTPYGASHVEHAAGSRLSQHELALAEELGARVAKAAFGLRTNQH
ncbi:NAD(P)H:quinone oxidoreductase [Pseudidiomarina terrestris]|uniref:NAD(P)H:quinone oxidoreductase n=1 Tax=Pseudidiomarina terrestris TaxID=2820060 RepID=A0AAW7QYZ1_9GAMM|nr:MULTISPECIES: NAD(P)H:quinone oxidoreductase [unclassified Pseudidiomarina]MDN7124095.1 NAD(P)H:quinone oxidoreductase [Pseudidiomarina sp. 1APP75-32.1]MDN7127167.1 NAD(P)H:quinone oxidoreductase [Pseudidiomarina sp. 1APR75-33.1]MDN7128352.1 NAD(P)H:quinone oxidoreductase [Pseudidiomarina sp. 1APR75-15]MDN7135420.1 NAD(P)H:quinone oxidoreductase [Pseudidiomarina sp. 1ASP75-5]MEA3586842.1 NAD(P)H:quinone oxidoreductase [Pseudidiomarina sp. 1APP75-27a]